MDRFKLSGLGFLFVSIHAAAQYSTFTDVADVDYYINEQTVDLDPSYYVRRGVSKEPHLAVPPIVNADNVTLKYGWKIYTESDSAANPYSSWDGVVTKNVTVTDSQIVDIASDLIGTPYDGLTCAALLDAGFLQPCAIPPIEAPPDAVLGSCSHRNMMTGVTASAVSGKTLNECMDSALAGAKVNAPQYAGYLYISRANCSTALRLTIWGRYAANTANREIIGYFDVTSPNICLVPVLAVHDTDHPTSTVPSSEPVVSDATDAELFDILKPAITSDYILNHSTGKFTWLGTGLASDVAAAKLDTWIQDLPSPAGTSANLDLPLVGGIVAPAYVNTVTPYIGSDPQPEPVPEPVPEPSPEPIPEPSPGAGDGLDCLVNWDTLACQQPDTFIEALVDTFFDSSVGDTDLTEFDAQVLETQDLGADLSPVALAGSTGCPAPATVTLSGGQVLTFENAALCDGLTSVRPVVLLLSMLTALFVLVGKGD